MKSRGCGVEVPVISYLRQRNGCLQLFWFDAHADINSPETSPSKYFHGMPLRFLLETFKGNEISDFVCQTISHSDVVLLGVRDLDEPERFYIDNKGIRMLSSNACNRETLTPEDIVGSSSTSNAYIHIDLDSIDPLEYRNVKCPAKEGISIARIGEMIAMIKSRKNVVGISILENMEKDRRRLEKLRPIIEHTIDF